MGRTHIVAVAVALAVVACSSQRAAVLMTVDTSPPTVSERTNIEGVLTGSRNLDFLGAVSGPHGKAIVVRYGDGIYDACYAVFGESGYSNGCGSMEPPSDSLIVATVSDGAYTGLLVETDDDVTTIRVTTGTGETYEVPRLSDLSYIAFVDDLAGYTLSVLVGDKAVHTEG